MIQHGKQPARPKCSLNPIERRKNEGNKEKKKVDAVMDDEIGAVREYLSRALWTAVGKDVQVSKWIEGIAPRGKREEEAAATAEGQRRDIIRGSRAKVTEHQN